MSEDEFYVSVGIWMRKQRKHYHMRQEDLAGKVGLSRTSIVNIEAGRQRISLFQFVQISEAIAPSDPCEQIRLATAGLLSGTREDRLAVLRRVGALSSPATGEGQ